MSQQCEKCGGNVGYYSCAILEKPTVEFYAIKLCTYCLHQEYFIIDYPSKNYSSMEDMFYSAKDKYKIINSSGPHIIPEVESFCDKVRAYKEKNKQHEESNPYNIIVRFFSKVLSVFH